MAATPEEILGGATLGSPATNGAATAVLEGEDVAGAWVNGGADTETHDTWAGAADDGPGRVVRIKDHPGDPITVDQALFQMELVGHDFYLFKDADTQLCSVVYRRKGFDYGLLRLTPTADCDRRRADRRSRHGPAAGCPCHGAVRLQVGRGAPTMEALRPTARGATARADRRPTRCRRGRHQ